MSLQKRTHLYVQRPKVFEMSPCACGNDDPDWSEFKGLLWCQKCEQDFAPRHGGVFDGPVAIHACEMLGIYFDQINLATNEIEADPLGNIHFSIPALPEGGKEK